MWPCSFDHSNTPALNSLFLAIKQAAADRHYIESWLSFLLRLLSMHTWLWTCLPAVICTGASKSQAQQPLIHFAQQHVQIKFLALLFIQLRNVLALRSVGEALSSCHPINSIATFAAKTGSTRLSHLLVLPISAYAVVNPFLCGSGP